MNDREAIILGALLHDIGKLVQRAQENPKSQDHYHWGGEFFQVNLSEILFPAFSTDELHKIESAIRNHHDWVDFITLADRISAGMERIPVEKEEGGDPYTDRLISIFSRISIPDKPKQERYHKLAYLYEDKIKETSPIEEKKCSYQEYEKLLDEFLEEIRSIELKTLSQQQVIEVIYFLLWKYIWCIPSAAYKDEPDISLFDHLKTTSAIATCLYDYHKENPNISLDIETPAFCTVEGDISGIQDYIFSILTQQGKVAKRLRARSLFIQLISEIAAHKILHKFNLPLGNLLSSAGGNFQILIPNLKTRNDKIEKLQKEFDEWTLKNYPELSINLATVIAKGVNPKNKATNDKDLYLSNFSRVMEELKNRLMYKKYQPYKLALVSAGNWNEKFLGNKTIESDEEACHSCRKYSKFTEYGEEKLCKYCFDETKIGELLPKKKYIALFNNDREEFKILDYSFKLCDEKELNKVKDTYLIFILNNTRIKLPALGFKFLANYIPTTKEVFCNIQEHQHKEGEPIFFDCIAEKSEGDKLLGYLKIDIDNMGKILRYGFKSPSISRFVAFSRMLENFFSGYIQVKLKNEFKNIYTVFSGGDDLFVIGPWNKIIDLASMLRKELKEYCANNPDLTFSGGIKLFKPHEPIAFCAQSVNDSLDCSKERKDKNYEVIKDGVTVFGQTMGWNELDKVLIEAKKVIKWLNEDLISHSLIYNFHKYGDMAKKSNIYEPKKEILTNNLKFVSLLTSDINRNLTKEEQKEVYSWAIDLLPSIEKKEGGDNLPYLKIIMEYVLTYTRGGEYAKDL